MAELHRPQDGKLAVILYGKTADLIRTECTQRQMGYDQFVKDVLWCWFLDLERERVRRRNLAARQGFHA